MKFDSNKSHLLVTTCLLSCDTAIKKLYLILEASCLPTSPSSCLTNLFRPGRDPKNGKRSRTKKETSAHRQSAVRDEEVSPNTQTLPEQAKSFKLFSCAMSMSNMLGEAHVAAIQWRNEIRSRITALVYGVKVDLLYYTGAMSSCLTMDT